jgi:hypothetical protein
MSYDIVFCLRGGLTDQIDQKLIYRSALLLLTLL